MCMIALIIALSIAYLIYLWLDTDVFIEYIYLFKLDSFNFLYIKDYLNYTLKASSQNYKIYSYPVFLAINHHSFWTRLLSCPICLSFWLSVIISFFFQFYLILAISFLSSFFYFLLSKLSKNYKHH